MFFLSKNKGIRGSLSSTTFFVKKKRMKRVYPAPLFFTKKSGAGFSLVEMIMYVMIMAIVATMVAAFLPQLVRNNMYVQARSEVLGNIKSALETMSQEVRHASSVYTPTSVFDASPGQLSLETVRNAVAGEDYTFVDFFVDDGGLYVKKEGQVEQIIVSEKIQVESLTFTHLNSVDQHQAVRISITASFDTPSSEVQDQSRVTLTTTVSFRQY
ncbi:MAG: hypothetical protein A2469_04625 [Candidatus Magasanikbacteria bacterium RIFOXYC2_FULL_40_16]|uniref:Type II secretion system protein n=2 Tax=Candidatus Magasanikiibacteriota TaxID=1752731 RepID=A0A1F6NZK5_9BACT|nr:MAG: hypothetical protein A2224_02225 [Candidatus Magasanikbacteria bacterium RIFOXYA2_FULL_40_20]OGH87380.1 MAG: hypothetical protein A2206_00045 [Candidatus Magasanikbacteria bacterium RIFOXYA1_FULL_40_8]OGH89321.1 MAG: hypothetical protein A2469_04625 [Candidatus Magasanikbacteria bacterium RIFOXYC2_FULL_40_16]